MFAHVVVADYRISVRPSSDRHAVPFVVEGLSVRYIASGAPLVLQLVVEAGAAPPLIPTGYIKTSLTHILRATHVDEGSEGLRPRL